MGGFFSVLFIGGTGAISYSAVKEALSQGMEVTVLNRGRASATRPLPAGVQVIQADVADFGAVAQALKGRRFDAVADFLCYNGEDARARVEALAGVARHLVHISSASVYHRPLPVAPVAESTLAHSPKRPYMAGKVETEQVYLDAFKATGFPVTIVRPAHTYDGAITPLPGSWALVDRIERGEPVVVPGDGANLWTLTHAADFAVGLVGLFGRPSAFGEAFHMTSDDVLSWDQIYSVVAYGLGVEPNLVHLPTEMILKAAPDWFWSGLFEGDLAHTEIFDNAKIKRYVPAFNPVRRFEREIHRIVAWRREHPDLAQADPAESAMAARLAAVHAKLSAVI